MSESADDIPSAIISNTSINPDEINIEEDDDDDDEGTTRSPIVFDIWKHVLMSCQL